MDLNSAMWRKSTLCNSTCCVETAFFDEHVAVRDSKDPAGPVLVFTHAEWAAFLGGVRDGEFELA